MAMYDLPAMINYILQKTGQEQLYFVAYSQGTTTGFIAFSSIPELDCKIKMFFALAPITTSSNMKSPLVRVFDLPEGMIKVRPCHTLIWNKGEGGNGKVSSPGTCSASTSLLLCSLVLYLPGGFTNSLNMSRLDVYLSHYPDSTSLKNMLHWRQGPCSPLSAAKDLLVLGYNPWLLSLKNYIREKGENWHETGAYVVLLAMTFNKK
uniref:AB hydrolase-1 domain-containing protein n=1 Tax=Athene cunicularia TaxID=194338 RepID=A0A663LMH5_ATHCN